MTTRCASMDEAGLGANPSSIEVRRLCSTCIRRANLAADNAGVEHTYLHSFASREELDRVECIIQPVNQKNWSSFHFEELAIGDFAAYEFSLRTKFYGADIPDNLWGEYRAHLVSTLRTLIAWKNFLEVARVDAVLVENEFYGVNRAIAEYSRRKGIPTWSVYHGTSVARFGRSLAITSHPRQWLELNREPAWADAAPDSKDLKIATEWLVELTLGRSPWVYSSKYLRLSSREVLEKLGVIGSTKVALALTSSPDEPKAADRARVREKSFSSSEGGKFKDQVEWLRYLIEQYRKRNDQTLVLRIHPRLLANKREQTISPFASQLRALEESAPPNVVFNWPDSGLPLWDVFSVSDRVFNYSSTAGLEAILLGLPVVQYEEDLLHSYPPELNSSSDGDMEFRPDYPAIMSESAWKKIELAYRWISWKYARFTINPDSRIPDRRKLTVLRILNWAHLRKGLWAINWSLPIVEAIELSRQRVDNSAAERIHAVINQKLDGFQELPLRTQSRSETSPLMIKSTHLRTMRRILRHRFTTFLSRVSGSTL